jgi:parallel beta-helix repeat protein
MRNQITEEVRSLAQKEAVAGDTAWNAAEDAGDAPEQAKALYDLARSEYAKTLEVAEKRASEPQETSARVEENLAAAKDRARKARESITDDVRENAQQQAAEADALLDLATQTAEHDRVKATELFEQARVKYDDAAAAAESAKRQAFVAKLREQGVVVSPTGKDDYATIGEAIDAVEPDTPIFIKPGVYKEAVVIDKPVALIGEGEVSEIRIESSDADCVTIKTTQAVVHGLTLRSTASFDGRGVYTVYCAEGRLLIEYCDIATDSLSAVAVTGANTMPTIRGCNIHDSTQAGIFFYDGARGAVENCELAANGLAGIQIKSGANPTVRQCKIRQSKGSGVFVNENGFGIIESCDISQNALAGVSIATNGNPTVRDCTLDNNRRYGVRAYDGGRGTIEECSFSDNEPENWFICDECDVTRQNNRE